MNTISETECEQIRKKANKNITKCLESLPAKKGEDKKYDEKLKDARIVLSIAYGADRASTNTQSALSSADNIQSKSLKKTLSQVGPRIQTHNTKYNQQANSNQKSTDFAKTKSVQSLKTQSPSANSYKIINP